MDSMTLGNAIKSARDAKRWAQPVLAKKAAIGQNTLSRIENGHTDPKASTLRRICEALGVTADSILWPRPGAR